MTPAIATSALRKVYAASPNGRRPPGRPAPGEGGVVALEALDLEVREGEFFGLLGPNGAGKSTTLGILTRRIRPTAGTALVAGEDVVRHAPRVRQRIGVVPQRPNPDRGLDVSENLVFHAAYFGVPRGEAEQRAARLLETLSLTEKRGARVDELSGGQQQRLMIARALIHEPEVIFLDEPTAGVDFELRLELWRYIRRLHAEGTTILLTTHYLEEAEELCEEIALIRGGRLLARDSADGLRADYDATSLADVYVKAMASR